MVANLRRMLDIGNLDKNSLKGLPGLDGSSMEAWDCDKIRLNGCQFSMAASE